MADPSDRSQRREQRAEVQARHAAARFEAPGDLVLAVDDDGNIVYLSPGWAALLNTPSDALFGTPIDEALAKAEAQIFDLTLDEPDRARPLSESSATSIVLRFGDEASPGTVLEGRVYRGLEDASIRLMIFRDETSKWRALALLDRDERRFRVVAEASRQMLSETDANGHFVYVSDACEPILGYRPDELLGTSALELHPPEAVSSFIEQLQQSARTKAPFRVAPHRLRRRDGTWIWAEALGLAYSDASGSPQIVGVARDVTDEIEAEHVRRNLDARMLRGQKLESLGVLAGGIAHDFNNLLTPIVGNVGLALLDLPEDSPVRKRVEMIKAAAQRATALTRQILAFAGQGVPTVEAVNISTTLEEMQLLLESTTSKSTTIDYELAEAVPMIEVDRTHIGQVAMNLVANASEGFGEEPGRIEVKTGSMYADQQYLDACFIGENLEKGEYAYLEVSDDGPGISAELQSRIFDPFFTTRFIGRGLGLTAVDGIVRGYRGALELMSVEGQGTRIRVLFPSSQLAASGPQIQHPGHTSEFGDAAAERRGTILVVDDDENTCELMAAILDRANFRVIQASGGAAAVKFYERHMDEITGVVLDYTMPLISGAEVFDSIRQLRPDARIILVSGYAQARAAEDLLDRGLFGFVQKPFTPDDLVAEVERLVDDVTVDRD